MAIYFILQSDNASVGKIEISLLILIGRSAGPHQQTTAIHGVRYSYFLNTFLVIKIEFVSNLYKSHIVGKLVSSELEIL